MKKSTEKMNTRIDLVLLILFLFGSIYFIVEMLLGEMIPLKYVLLLGIGVFVLFLLIYLTFKWHNTFIYVFRRIVLGLLCTVLIIGAIFQSQLRNAFLNVNDGSTIINRMHVIVLKDSTYKTMDDLTSIGYVENGLISSILEEIQSKKLIQFDDQMKAYSQLNSNQVDGILITDKDYTFEVERNDSYFNKKYRILHTLEKNTINGDVINKKNLKEPFVVYVSGLDNIGKPTYNGLSDVNMLLMVDPKNHRVEMISINRDSYVPNAKYNDYPDKLTHLGWNGANAGAEALERVFGIEIDFTVKVTFESLIKIIDALGGIDVDVQISFKEQDENRTFAEGNVIQLEKGFQHLNGREALAYARHRKSDGWGVKGREKAQRQIIAAVAHKVLSIKGAFKIGEVLNVAASYVATNLPMSSARSFIMNAIDDVRPWSFGSSTVDSDIGFLMPCASYPYTDLFAVLLSKDDIQKIHDMYVSVNEVINLNEFEFDLNDMDKYTNEFDYDPRVITLENYYQVVPTYFSNYIRYNF